MYIHIVVDYSHWIVVNICMGDWVICSCIICRVGCYIHIVVDRILVSISPLTMMFLLHHEVTTLEEFGTTCIHVSCIGAYHIGTSLNCCMWMMIVDDKYVWWIHTCDIWNWLVGELCHNWICDLMNLCIGEICWMFWSTWIGVYVELWTLLMVVNNWAML